MGKRKIVIFEFLAVLVLASCSTGNESRPGINSELDQGSTAQGSAVLNAPQTTNFQAESDSETSGGGDFEPTPEDQISFVPTPSPIFEQNYGLNQISDRDYRDLELVTLLPPDAIPAMTFPDYYAVEEANREYQPEELVIGVEFNGDARAYSVSLLSRHEIVNDTVGGIHLAVTW